VLSFFVSIYSPIFSNILNQIMPAEGKLLP
jgi:hypothetical protein